MLAADPDDWPVRVAIVDAMKQAWEATARAHAEAVGVKVAETVAQVLGAIH